jgi:hypothetical protein
MYVQLQKGIEPVPNSGPFKRVPFLDHVGGGMTDLENKKSHQILRKDDHISAYLAGSTNAFILINLDTKARLLWPWPHHLS